MAGLVACLLAWAFCRRSIWVTLAQLCGALACLYVISRNLGALPALPLILAAGYVEMKMPRGRLGFQVYYPVHRVAPWVLGLTA